MRTIKSKLKNKTLSLNDLDIIITKIKSLIESQETGFAEFSDDDIQNLEIYKIILKSYLDKTRNIQIEAKGKIDYHKTKIILDELSLNQIISDPLWSIGGFCRFEVIDLNRLRTYLYKNVEIIIQKMPKLNIHIPITNFLKAFFTNPWVIGFSVTVLGGLIVAYIAFHYIS